MPEDLVKLAEKNATTELTEISGEACLLLREGAQPLIVMALSIDDERVTEIRVIGNPDKLNWIKNWNVSGESSEEQA